MSLKVFGYIRVSTENQVDNTSLTVQRERITAWCKGMGHELVHIFDDAGVSGKTTDRQGYQDMLSRLDECGLIVMLKTDRVSRNLKDILIFWEDMLVPQNVALKALDEPFDSSTPEGKLMLQMLGGFAEFERTRINERTTAGRIKNAENGGSNGGPTPYGYVATPDGDMDFEVVEAQADIVKELFRVYATGRYGFRKAGKLAGCPMSPEGIKKMLRSPFYCGKIKYNNIVRRNNHHPIITERQFSIVQKVMAKRANITTLPPTTT